MAVAETARIQMKVGSLTTDPSLQAIAIVARAPNGNTGIAMLADAVSDIRVMPISRWSMAPAGTSTERG